MVELSKRTLFLTMVMTVLTTCVMLNNFSPIDSKKMLTVAIDTLNVRVGLGKLHTECGNDTQCVLSQASVSNLTTTKTPAYSTTTSEEQDLHIRGRSKSSIKVEITGNLTLEEVLNSTRCMPKVMLNVTQTLLNANKVTPRSVLTDLSRNLTIYGRIRGGGRYGVYASSIGNPVALKYLFVLPLTVLAWNRIGFDSVVILVADSNSCKKEALITYMVAKLLSKNATVILVEAEPRNTIMMSQTSRIFAASLLSQQVVDNPDRWPETFFITSDSDIWPLHESPYTLAPNKSVLTLHGNCCGSFHHKGKRYRMLPMANLGMRQSTWTSVLSRYNTGPPHSPRAILEYFIREFGQIVTEPVTKGGNFGWYMDQKMLSVVVWDWVQKDRRLIDLGVRPGLAGRIGYKTWNTTSLGNKVDTHLLNWAYKPKSWNRIMPLLKMMHDRETVKWCYDYLIYFRVHFSGDTTYRIPTAKV